MEEFYESDVLGADDYLIRRFSEAAAASNAYSPRERMTTSTGPVDIPAASYRSSREHLSDDYVVRGRNGKIVVAEQDGGDGGLLAVLRPGANSQGERAKMCSRFRAEDDWLH